MNRNIQELALETAEKTADHREEVVSRLEPLIKKSLRHYYYGNMAYEDLMQEGRLRILKELDRFDPKRKTAFLGVAQLSLKYLYCELRRKQAPLCLLNVCLRREGDDREEVDLIDGGGDVEAICVEKEGLHMLRTAFAALDPAHRDILTAFYVKGESLRHMAERGGVHYMTAVQRKKRAVEALRKKLAEMKFTL